ncbi:MAG: DUF2939 domain-containing protein [Candidatus Binataceae bacterium]
MVRFAFRHWTAILILIAIAVWAAAYLPTTPSYAIFQLKQAVDARDGAQAAQYVDFRQVVRNAGYEMLRDPNSPGGSIPGQSVGPAAPPSTADPLGELLGEGAVDLLSGPAAALLKSWAIQQVNSGAKEVQIPPAGVTGAILLLHRSGNNAYTRFTDRKGQTWGVRMRREDDAWKIVKVDNVKQLLAKLQHQARKNYGITP